MSMQAEHALNRLVAAALTIFIVLVLLLAAVILRHFWLQQQVAALSSDVQMNLEDVEAIAGELEEELNAIRATPGSLNEAGEWEEITDALDDLDNQLDSLEAGLDEVTLVLEPDTAVTTVPDDNQVNVVPGSGPVNDLFTIFAVLVALASIGIAVLLGLAVRMQQRLT